MSLDLWMSGWVRRKDTSRYRHLCCLRPGGGRCWPIFVFFSFFFFFSCWFLVTRGFVVTWILQCNALWVALESWVQYSPLGYTALFSTHLQAGRGVLPIYCLKNSQCTFSVTLSALSGVVFFFFGCFFLHSQRTVSLTLVALFFSPSALPL